MGAATPSLTLNNCREAACGVLPRVDAELKAAGGGAEAGRGAEELVVFVELTRLLSPGR